MLPGKAGAERSDFLEHDFIVYILNVALPSLFGDNLQKPRTEPFETGGEAPIMSTVMSQSAQCKKAMAWIDEQRRDTDTPLPKLLEEASMRFNLGPNDCAFLQRFYSETQD